MATPVTQRNDPAFSPLGIVNAAVLGLTAAPYNTNANLEFIPNMDGFPNGRRLEDDVTLIELQAVSGVALAAIGLWYDDYTAGGSPVTQDLLDVLTYSTGVSENDVDFSATFPYVAMPFSGTGDCGGLIYTSTDNPGGGITGLSQKPVLMKNFPNPFQSQTTFEFKVNRATDVTIRIFDLSGALVATPFSGYLAEGEHTQVWNSAHLPAGFYAANLYDGYGNLLQSGKLVKQ
jgi:hypothetical protein